MILEWLVPVSSIILGARLLWMHARAGWHGVADVLQTAGSVVIVYFMIDVGFDVRHSLGVSLVVAPILLAGALIPTRTALRLVGGRRPNEIEEPDLFTIGERKPPEEQKELRESNPD